MNEFDLISIGDSTIDVFLEVDPQDAESSCSLDHEKCVVSFEFGAKIPVKSLVRVAGVGNAPNLAIGSVRLGLKTALYTVLGSDRDSQECKEVFEKEGVDTKFVVMENDKRSGFSAVINYSAERNIFRFREDHEYQLPNFPQASWVYYTSIGKGSEVLHEPLVAYLKNTGAKLGFNPGTLQIREGIETIKPMMAVANVLLVNREEAYKLVRGEIEDIRGLLADLKATGPEAVVITDGRGGSYASIDGREVWFCPIPEESPVVERTGCGDAYSTGFLAAMVQGRQLPEAMLWGTMNATSVIQYIGAREGLLTPEGMQKTIEKWGNAAKPQMI